MSLCDVCMSPGACCKKVALSGSRPGPHGERFETPMSFERAEHLAMLAGLPFRPAEQDEKGIWRWWCPALQSDGRCGIYESRPDLCRRYLPGSDGLCVHYWPRPLPAEDDPLGADELREADRLLQQLQHDAQEG